MSSTSVRGVVTNCLRLQVLEYPDEGAPVVGSIPALTEVIIENDEFDFEFSDYYKICTVTSLEGYCLKQFIAVPLS